MELRFSNAVGLMGDFYDRYKKNIFFAFPFDVDDHEFYTLLAGGRAHSTGEKIRICPMDFTIVEEWLAVEGEDGVIGIRSEDMPVFHLSQINYNRFLKSPEYPKSHVYLYAASNRTNNLNFCTPEDCCGTYHLTILMQNVVFLIMQLIDNRIFIRPFTKRSADIHVAFHLKSSPTFPEWNEKIDFL